MQSIKNTAVSIILLFLSYGVYQVITKPMPNEIVTDRFEPLDISEPIQTGIPKDLAEDMQTPIGYDQANNSEVIPKELLEQQFENPGASQPNFTSLTDPEDKQLADFPDEDFSSTLSNSTANDRHPSASQISSFDQQDVQFAATSRSQQDSSLNQQLDSDSHIIPTTLMTPISKNHSGVPDNIEPAAPKSLSESWQDINRLVEQGDLQPALQKLSTFYRDRNFDTSEQQQLMDWLDALAAKVIYSTEHHLRSLPYIIQPGDTIGSLARKWQVPAQLIYNVNIEQIPDPNDLKSGVEIKLIQGPFDAEVDSQDSTMTLYLGKLYAGRFNVETRSLQSGSFRIVDKSAQDHLDRPYWIALDNGASIYATDAKPNVENEIGLNLREAEEVFSILSATSKIKVLR